MASNKKKKKLRYGSPQQIRPQAMTEQQMRIQKMRDEPDSFCFGAAMQLLRQIDVFNTKQPKFNIVVKCFGAKHLASLKQVVG